MVFRARWFLAGNGTVTKERRSRAAVLTTGVDNSDSTFSGVLQERRTGGIALVLTKAGGGTLVLTGANTIRVGRSITGGDAATREFCDAGFNSGRGG